MLGLKLKEDPEEAEFLQNKSFRPVLNRKHSSAVNDLYVRKSEKRKIVIKSAEITLPNL